MIALQVEVEGVLNPAAARGRDGELYLFPRLVAQGNYSRIGIARVRFNEAGDPAGVERLGIALQPEADYERRPDGSGGCEDPRITFVEPMQHEGWRTLPAHYDDGGYSGGNLERPALKSLLDDIQANKVDTIVVYKVDRLTRSLADFAKIVEALDARGVSFVSVTRIWQ